MKMRLPAGRQGFALFIAVIFMSVMLTFGLALGSLGYKQQILASAAIESQHAFYAADAALECALYADQQLDFFAHRGPSQPEKAPKMTCDGSLATFTTDVPNGIVSWNNNKWVITMRLSLDSGMRCADITVHKPADASETTYLFSQGYNVPCATVEAPGDARFSSRGLDARY